MNIKLTFLVLIAFFSSVGPASLAAQKLYYNYQDAGGDWESQEISHRIALMADSDGQMGFMDIGVPKDGYYHIYASLLHTWNNASPKIDIRIYQQGKIRLVDSFSGEPGELSHQHRGRWLHKSIGRGEMLFLKKGTARIEFRLSGLKKIRELQQSAIEKKVYLGSFVVVPGSIKTGFMNILEAERAQGDWDVIEYKTEESCGVLESLKDEQAQLNVFLPKSGMYILMASIHNKVKTEISTSVFSRNRTGSVPLSLKIESDEHWKVQHFITRYYESGEHAINLQNVGVGSIQIDNFFMVPFFRENQKISLSCSTVYFYHNPGSIDLTEALQKIADSGFKAVDIVAYDDTFGIGEQTTENTILEIKKQLQRLELKVSSIHIGAIPLRSTDEAVAKIQWALRVASTLEAKRIIAPPILDIDGKTFLTQAEGLQSLTQIIDSIKPLLEKQDVELGLENHSGRQWLFRTSHDFLTARTLLSRNVYFVPDEDHLLLAGEDPVTAFGLLAPYSSVFHFKTDSKERIMQLWDILKMKQWSGHISLEVEQPSRELDSWFKIYKKHIVD